MLLRCAGLLALVATAAYADDNEPEVPTLPQGVCETIEESPFPDDDDFFNFHQHDDRLDPNKFVKVVFKIMSELKPEPIKKVQLDFNPILHHLVGKYTMKSTVTHQSKDGHLVDHCYDIVITIHDTDECTFKGARNWMHTCDASTQCVNTQGGYYCACPENHFAKKGSGNGKCDGNADSTSCCGEVTYDGAPHGDHSCREDFQCHADSCAFNDCSKDATCIPGGVPNTYTCQCNSRYRDVGAKAKPGRECLFVDHCADPDSCPVGCDCNSVVNSEKDGFFCSPKAGYATYYPAEEYEWVTRPKANKYRLDEVPHLCASQAMPEIQLLGSSTLVLTQGQKYVEEGVKITDVSTVDLKRRFTTDYSDAEALMDLSGFTKECGEYSITYSLATPWVQGRAAATATRKVVVKDVDECTYRDEDPQFLNHCLFPAKCVNAQCGTGQFSASDAAYECVCDHHEYEPDGKFGCRKIGSTPEEAVLKEKEVFPTHDHDHNFYKKLVEALEEIKWNEDRLGSHGLRNYKSILKKLADISGEKHEHPPDIDWAKPYQSLAVAELREMAVRRGLASPLGAASADKADLVKKLAHGDHAEFDHDKHVAWTRR